MRSELLASIVPPGPGLPVPWWVFWWVLAGVAFVLAFWWWSYLAVRHDRDLHDEARDALRRQGEREPGEPPVDHEER